MKRLYDFIQESIEQKIEQNINESKEKSFVFNFGPIDDADDFIKSLEEVDNVTIDDKKVSVTVSDENKDNLENTVKVLKEFIDKSHKASHAVTDDSYATKVKSLQTKLDELNAYVEELKNPQSEEGKKDDKKEEE